jgi:fructose-1,6-bisphosphatase I
MGVLHSFILDPSLGEFILADEQIRIPDWGSVYSVNEGNFWQWSEGYRNYIKYVHAQPSYSACAKSYVRSDG